MPKVTDELRISDRLVRVTFRREMSFTTGAEIVVINKRMALANSKKVPKWWKMPVLAILETICSKIDSERVWRLEESKESVVVLWNGGV